MSDPQANKDKIMRWVQEVFNAGHLEVMREIFSPNCVTHSPDGATWAGTRVTAYRQALPDLHKDVDLLLSDGDYVVLRSTNVGTHRGELDHADLGPAPATGREVRWSSVDIYRFENGVVVEIWAHVDVVGALRQFGLMPKSTPTYI